MYELKELVKKLLKYKAVRVDFPRVEYELSKYLDYEEIEYTIEYKEAHCVFKLKE